MRMQLVKEILMFLAWGIWDMVMIFTYHIVLNIHGNILIYHSGYCNIDDGDNDY